MKTKHFFFFGFFLATLSLWAQTGYIGGKVIDKINGEGVPLATVALYPANSPNPVAGTTTLLDGSFELAAVPYGNYRIEISFIGYETQAIQALEIGRGKSRMMLGNIVLSPLAQQLDEITVTGMAKTEIARIDRKTYRASDFETARGGTATEVLNLLPAVSVSAKGEVSLRGTTDILVYLNGRPVQMDASTVLSQIPADDIESIEIITVPGAQYDAQGKGGIINIITKSKSRKGYSTRVNALLGGAPWGNRVDEFSGYALTDNRYGGGVSFRMDNHRLTFIGGVNYLWREVNAERTGTARILTDTASSVFKHMDATGTKPEWYENFSGNAGIEYALSDRTKLSASYFYGTRLEGRKAHYLYRIYNADINGNRIEGVPIDEQWIYNPNEGIRTASFRTVGADLQHRWDENRRLNASLLYEQSELSQRFDNPNIRYNPLTQQTEG